MPDTPDLTKLIFGRLTWEAFPYHEPILVATFIAVMLGGLAIVGAMTYFRAWGERPALPAPPMASTAIICRMHILPVSTQRLRMASYRPGATLA